MPNKKQKASAKKKVIQVGKTLDTGTVNGTTTSDKKIIVTSGDKNSQVLAATVGGAVLGNLIAPGIGGAIFGGLVGALLGNDAFAKGRK